MTKKIRTAIFPVGGFGTRFLPATKAIPKEMLPVAGKPIIQYAFEEARDAGIERFIFITGRNKNAINNHFDHSYELQEALQDKNKQEEIDLLRGWLPPAGHIAFVRQLEPKGLGHAIWCARNFIGDEPFAVILADEMIYRKPEGFLKLMLDNYYDNLASKWSADKVNMVATYTIDKNETNRYGIISPKNNLGNDIMEISDMVEKPEPKNAPSNLAIIGRYILQPEIMDYLAKHKIGSGGEIQLTDAMVEMLNNDKKQLFFAIESKDKRFDCGNKIGFLEANLFYSMQEFSDEEKAIMNKKILEII